MPKNRIIILLGGLIAVIHILDGLPQAWESFLGALFGLSIVVLSIWSSIDKKLTLRAKAQKRQLHKRRLAEIEAQSAGALEAQNQALPEESI